MRSYLAVLAACGIGLTGCPKQDAQTSGEQTAMQPTNAADSGSTGGGDPSQPLERLVAEDGRLQQLDAYGNPMFDAEGNPVWEPTPAELAQQAFEEALALMTGVGGAEPDFFNAASKLKQATTLVPEMHPAWFNLGLAQLEQNLLGEAVTALERSTELEPGHMPGWRSLGVAYERAGRLNDADVAYSRGLEQDPESIDLLNGKARLARKRGQLSAAVEKARGIIKINANSLDAYNTLGLAYLGLGDFELARFVFVKAQNDVPGGKESPSIEANLGLVYFREGREFEAEEHFEKARELDPDHVGAMVNLAYLKLKNLDHQGAHELLEQAYKVLPGSVPIQLNLAVARRGIGDFAGAQRLLEEIVAEGSEHSTDALLNLAILQGDFLKDYDASISTYQEYLAVRERAGAPVPEDDPVREYLEDIEKLKRKEDKRKEKAEKKAADADAAPPEPEPVEEPGLDESSAPAEQNSASQPGDGSEQAPAAGEGAADGEEATP